MAERPAYERVRAVWYVGSTKGGALERVVGRCVRHNGLVGKFLPLLRLAGCSMLYRGLLRRVFFRMDPERAHGMVMLALRCLLRLPLCGHLARRWMRGDRRGMVRELMGLRFEGLVGLPAGFDKGAHLMDRIDALGFGFAEVGTVTPRPQPGNPRPRIFRLPADGALVNRMGFNSEGLAVVSDRLHRRRRHRIPVGVSLGKNTDTPQEGAVEDYVACLRCVGEVADFVVVNVSCPNVACLTGLQASDTVGPLVSSLVAARRALGLRLPILVKLGPYQEEASLRATVRTALKHGADGFVACNTSPDRRGLRSDAKRVESIGAGGLSGAPLRGEALRTVRLLREEAGRGVPIIGVGGVFHGADALALLQAGASLVQVYTGFIYEGPLMVRRINRYLHLHREEIPVW